MQKPALAIAILPLLIAEQVAELTAQPSSFPGQEKSNQHGQAQVQETSDEHFGPSQFVLQDGTRVKLRLNRNVSSADAR